MAEVTREMILEYMRSKSGVVKNVDLVRHFRKYLQLSDHRAKGVRVCVRLSLTVLFVCARAEALQGPKEKHRHDSFRFLPDFKGSLFSRWSAFENTDFRGREETFVVGQISA